MRFRRIIAAFIDIILVGLAFTLISSIIPSKSTQERINKIEELKLEEKNEEIDEILYELEKENVKYYLIFSLIIIVYFIIIPKYYKDQTYGQKVMKIRLVSEDEITFNTYTIRALMNSGIILLIFFSLFVYFLDIVWYSRVTSLILIIQITYWLVSFVIFIITKEAIHDKLTNSKIIEVKRWEN